MSKLSNENLFLLEFLVDQVTLRTECDCDTPGELCVSFQFLDNAALEIGENDFTSDESDDMAAKIGKSCLFSLTPEQIEESQRNFDVCVTVFKKIPPEYQELDKIVVGDVLISITNIFVELISNIDDSTGESPTAKTLQDTFDIFDDVGDSIGKIGLFLRMSCFGKLIITQFQMNFDDNSVLFKDKEGQSLYRYKKLKKKDENKEMELEKERFQSRMNRGNLKTCSKVYFNGKSNKSTKCSDEFCFNSKTTVNLDRPKLSRTPWTNPNCPEESCFDAKPNVNLDNFKPPCASSNYPASCCDDKSNKMMDNRNPNCPQQTCFNDGSNRMMDNKNPNYPQQSCFNDGSNRMMDNKNPNCPQQPCFNNQESPYQPTSSSPTPKQPYFENKPTVYEPSSLPIGKSMIPCNECLQSANAAFFPPLSTMNNNMGITSPCIECGQYPQNNINQMMMGQPPFGNISPIPCINNDVNLVDATCHKAEKNNSCGDYRCCPGLQEDNNYHQMSTKLCQNNDNYGNNYNNDVVKSTTTTIATATTQLEKRTINEHNDPNKDVFILRFGKRSEKMDKKKDKFELELCTPKCPNLKPKPRKVTRDCQYDVKDFQTKDKKKGKKSKSKKDKKKKNKKSKKKK